MQERSELPSAGLAPGLAGAGAAGEGMSPRWAVRVAAPLTAATAHRRNANESVAERVHECAGVIIHPIEGLGDGLLPQAVPASAFLVRHLRLEPVVDLPVFAQLIKVRPDSDGETGSML